MISGYPVPQPFDTRKTSGCAVGASLTPHEAHSLYRQSTNPAFAAHLFANASRLRDQHLGRSPWWSAGISAVTPCELATLCTYCTFFTRQAARAEDIAAAARAIAALGIRHLHLSGGTSLPDGNGTHSGHGQRLVEMVAAIRAGTDLEIEVNVGPSLTRGDVRALKQLGVCAITSSLEVLNGEVFSRFKPGDSLSGRIRLMELCEEEGMPIRSMMLVGLGESDADRVDHLLFLRRFPMLRHLRLSRYLPFPGAAAGGVRCSPWQVARLTALTRLLYPDLDIGLAAGNDADDLPLWWLAGGGNQIIGASASMKGPRARTGAGGEARAIPVGERIVVHDNMPRIARYLGEMGLAPVFSPRFRERDEICHAYRWKNVAMMQEAGIALSVLNLFDKNYIGQISANDFDLNAGASYYAGAPRAVALTLDARF